MQASIPPPPCLRMLPHLPHALIQVKTSLSLINGGTFLSVSSSWVAMVFLLHSRPHTHIALALGLLLTILSCIFTLSQRIQALMESLQHTHEFSPIAHIVWVGLAQVLSLWFSSFNLTFWDPKNPFLISAIFHQSYGKLASFMEEKLS